MSKLSHSEYAQLVRQAQDGDQSAFTSLYAATVEGQLFFATAFLKDASLAEEVAQEVYISLYKNLHNIRDGKTFIAYLNRICYNCCVDYKRKRQIQQQHEQDDAALAEQRDTSVSNNPDQRYAVLEQTSAIYGILSALPDEYRAAFFMRYYECMKMHGIAEALGLSVSSVKRYLKAATELLKEKME